MATANEDPAISPDETAAAEWHLDAQDRDPDHDISSCWCCCITCQTMGPYFKAGHAAMLASMEIGE